MVEFDIKGIVAKPGEKSYGFIDVGTTSVNTYKIPVAVVNGAKKGKTLCLLGGTHGTEFASIEAVIRVVRELDPKNMRGAVLAVTVLNGPQFEHRSAFLSPFDQLNQNRQFPGNAQGTLSQRTAYTVFNELVSRSDALIDAHGGDINEDIDCMVIADQGDEEKLNKVAIDMASCFPTKYIQTHKVGQVAGSSGIAMEKYGIPCITPEAGAPYPVRERHIKFHYDGIISNMKYFKILGGKPSISKPAINPKIHRFKANTGGIWHPRVELSESVSKGQEVGNLTDLFGNLLETYEAPDDSVVTFLRMFYSVNCGEQLLQLVVL